MIWLKKHFLSIINILCMSFVLIYTPLVAFRQARNYEIYTKPVIDTKIYSIWHVETFEGGSKPRINYLNSITRQLEKRYSGILFHIRTMPPEALASELSVNQPDIISYGYGVGNLVLHKAIPFDQTYGVRDNLLESGMFNSKLYALPYIASGYAVITHGSLTDNVHAGSGYTDISTIASAQGFNIKESESQYEAYKDFVYDKTCTLIGTGRDVFRVSNLKATGRINASITPIDLYTDLVQYLSIFTYDNLIEEFISIALSHEQQMTLSSYHLYSVGYNKIYTDGIYNDMENAIFNCQIPKVYRG